MTTPASLPVTSEPTPAMRRFAAYGWGNVGFLVLVILWGAWVRITHSGAGCGSHWPDCNGQIIPLSPTLETFIEFTHRLTSGLSLPLVIGLVVAACRIFPRGHRVRAMSWATLGFLIAEALVGAGLVKFDLVADNTSVARAITATFHLVNTFALTAVAALAAWWADPRRTFDWARGHRHKGLAVLGLAAILLTSMSGAITALGDTLFPTTVFAEGGLFAKLQSDISGATHFLVRLRIVHPLIAIASGIYLISMAAALRGEVKGTPIYRTGTALMHLASTQMAAGFVNILLAAPGWMQLVHLLLAVGVWTAAVLFTAVLGAPAETAEAPVPPLS
jgi:heme A synthase